MGTYLVHLLRTNTFADGEELGHISTSTTFIVTIYFPNIYCTWVQPSDACKTLELPSAY